jgi:hypothetical protein
VRPQAASSTVRARDQELARVGAPGPLRSLLAMSLGIRERAGPCRTLKLIPDAILASERVMGYPPTRLLLQIARDALAASATTS